TWQRGARRDDHARNSAADLLLCCFLDRHFFFQAEDGIRDWSVTGVQTCALPISIPVAPPVRTWPRWPPATASPAAGWMRCSAWRSEERRVGKEGRSRRWADH